MNTTSRSYTALALLGWIVLTFPAPAFGAFAPSGEWYLKLNKPSFNPPSWIFGPAWTTLYLLMATAAWRVWKTGSSPERTTTLGLYLVQLALNAAWTPVFFGLHRIGLGLAVIIALWVAIALTLRAFWKVDRAAGMMLIPYLAWVSFATALNAAYFQLNP